MAEDMITRAAKAVCPKLPNISASDCVQTHPREGDYTDRAPCLPTNCLSADIARDALLAALDMSNDMAAFQVLVTALAVADDGHPDGLKYRLSGITCGTGDHAVSS